MNEIDDDLIVCDICKTWISKKYQFLHDRRHHSEKLKAHQQNFTKLRTSRRYKNMTQIIDEKVKTSIERMNNYFAREWGEEIKQSREKKKLNRELTKKNK